MTEVILTLHQDVDFRDPARSTIWQKVHGPQAHTAYQSNQLVGDD